VSFLWLLFLPALLYQLLSLFASLRQAIRRPETGGFLPPISLLKPVRGLDTEMYAAFVSQASQDYPEFEILFGVADESDAAIPEIRRLQRQFPDAAIHLIVGSEPAANAKVGTLMLLARHARHAIWLVSDADIRVPADYLRTVAAPLENAAVGVVTCLYRPESFSTATAWEALGIAIDFMPSTLVAQMVGVREFGLGSTLCFRADDLRAAGGFEGIADYLADDYQLASRIVRLGKTAHVSTCIVDTSLDDGDWSSVWRHQLRWARTIRHTKGAGFAGLAITQAGIWAAAAASLGFWPLAGSLVGVRILAALSSGWLVIELKRTPFTAVLAPIWDIYAFAVWAISYTSNNVQWRDRKLKIERGGKLRAK
jgi:ceramide glucosyltransferase